MRIGGLAILPSPFRTMCGQRGTFRYPRRHTFPQTNAFKGKMRMFDYEKLEAAEEHYLEELAR